MIWGKEKIYDEVILYSYDVHISWIHLLVIKWPNSNGDSDVRFFLLIGLWFFHIRLVSNDYKLFLKIEIELSLY